MFLITFCIFLVLFSINVSAEQRKAITSWKQIVIGKTTEEEIIAGNPEGSVTLSVTELPKLTGGQHVLRVLEYGSEHSYAEEKRQRNEKYAWAHDEGGGKLVEAFKFLENTKLEDYFKPALLKNGPIDLRWDKLGRAKLYIYSNGIVQGWVMKYWFFNPDDFVEKGIEGKYLPSKDEVLEIFKIELGKPKKILKPNSQHDIYIFSLGKRKLELILMYFHKPKVQYVEFWEKGPLLLMSEMSDEKLKDLLSGVAELLRDEGLLEDKSVEKSNKNE